MKSLKALIRQDQLKDIAELIKNGSSTVRSESIRTGFTESAINKAIKALNNTKQK